MKLEIVKMKNEEQEKILATLNVLRDIEGVERVELVTRDGLPLFPDQGINILPAMAAVIIAIAETATTILGKGLPKQVIVETEQGKLIVRGVDPKILLVVIAEPETNIQLVGMEIERAVREIKKALGKKEEYGGK